MKIAIASGKGGTGKTTVATNLAKCLSETDNVVLADLDVEEPNSALFLKAELVKEEIKYKMIPHWNESKCESSGICQKVCNYNAIMLLGSQVLVFKELCHSCYACVELCPNNALVMKPERIGVLRYYHSEGLDFVEGRIDIGVEQTVPLIEKTKKFVDTHFKNTEIKLYDSPPGTSCPVIEATKDTDLVILVTEPTPFGLHDLTLSVETMRALGKRFCVVVNRWDLGNEDVLDYCKRENIEIIAKIDNNRRAAELYSKGDLLYDKLPDFKKEILNIKEYIFDRI